MRAGDVEPLLRRDARALIDAALRAVDPERLVAEALTGTTLPVSAGGRLQVVAVGKAAPGMLRGVRRALGSMPAGGLAVVPWSLADAVPPGVEVHRAGHPLPDRGSVAASAAVRKAAQALTGRDRLLLLLSGGGSALLTLPAAGLGLEPLRRVTRRLLESGAPIEELNAVRKHLEVLKGGGLARAAAPAGVRALVLSDVVGNRLDVIASGPVSPDPTSFGDAAEVLRRRGLWIDGPGGAPPAVRDRLEAGIRGDVLDTPKPGDPVFGRVEVSVVGDAGRAADAAAVAAAARGYSAGVGSVSVEGEARTVGARLAREARTLEPPACRIFAGETTVTVTGPGKGGRNQEVALGAAAALRTRKGTLVFSVGTDGVDGPTEAAGAWVTGRTMDRAEARGLDLAAALERNDAYPLLEALDDLIVTGPTGTNVMDLMGVLVGPPLSRRPPRRSGPAR